MASGAPILTFTQLGTLVLDLFNGLCVMHPTRTPGGALIHPMPTRETFHALMWPPAALPTQACSVARFLVWSYTPR